METTKNLIFAEVVLALPMERSFHYAIPEHLASSLKAGMRVKAPFGSKIATGYVVGLSAESPVANLKNIIEILDAQPIISEELFSLARWISAQYACSLGEALSAIVPSNLRRPKRELKDIAPTAHMPH